MRAVRFHEFGGPDKLVLEDVPTPSPGPDQVVVKIGASALNHLDVDIREGASRFPFELPHTPGIELQGEIHEKGSGDEVEKVLDLAGRGLIHPAIHKTYPLNEAKEAMETMESRSHFGKLVLVP